ncbi:MAG: TolC family protein [Leptospiraceae bacterium]|nr:TolC family protein [Leptospiraceae bacterium]
MRFFSILLFLALLPVTAQSSEDVEDVLETINPYRTDTRSEDVEDVLKEWDLDRIEKYSISNNPIYLAEKQNINMSRGDLITSALYRNPVFQYQTQFLPLSSNGFQNPFTTGSTGGPVEIAPAVYQDIDLAGVIQQQTKVAKKEFLSQIAAFEDFDRMFRLRLRQNYWLYLYVTELINFQKEFHENYNDLLELTKFRAEKGDISPLEYDRIFLEKIRIEKDYKESEILRSQVAKDLRFLIGISPKSKILTLKGHLKYVSSKELGIKMNEFNIEDRPDLKGLQLKVAKNRMNIELQKKQGGVAPFVNLGGEVRAKGNESYAGVFVTMPLKVFDRNQGNIFKAEEQYKKSILEVESKKKQIYAEIRAAMRELESREELLQGYDKVKLIDKNREVQEKYRLAYIRGASNLVSFLEAEKNYLTVLKGYYEQIYLYFNAIESYRAAVGKLGMINE